VPLGLLGIDFPP